MRTSTEGIEQYRDLRYSTVANGFNGVFSIPFKSYTFTVICSDGGGWDHVSVSLPGRCPNWPEMCFIKDLFFDLDETVIQFHPKVSEYVNNHPFCLHLWRDQAEEHWLPPSEMVGIKE